MTPDEEIQTLDTLLRQFAQDYPTAAATLRVTNTAFRASTRQRWESHGWTISDDELNGLVHGNDKEREAAFRSMLRWHNIRNVQVVPGVDIIAVVPAEEAEVPS
jgi:hypothetical protein